MNVAIVIDFAELQMDFVTQENALIFRITHHQNLPWILAHGLHCRNSPTHDPNFVEIGRPEIISRRSSRQVTKGPGGVLADYVPFYFNPRTPMLLNIKSGWQGLQQRPMNEIVIMVASLRKLALKTPCVFSDRNATLAIALFETDLALLNTLPWDLWKSNNFKKDDSDPQKIERYMAEALIHGSLAAKDLEAIVCYSVERATEVQGLVSAAGLNVPVHSLPGWYC